MQTNIGDRIKEAAKAVGGQRALSALVAVSERTMSDYCSGKSSPQLSVLEQISDATGTSLVWLVTGSESLHHQVAVNSKGNDMVLVPILDVHAAAGFGVVVEQETTTGVMALEKNMLRDLGITSTGALRLLQSAGDSMYPTIRSGEWLLVDTGIDRVVNEGIYIFRKAGAVIVKRIKITILGEVHLISDNGGGVETVSPDDLPDLHAAGRVIWVFRAI